MSTPAPQITTTSPTGHTTVQDSAAPANGLAPAATTAPSTTPAVTAPEEPTYNEQLNDVDPRAGKCLATTATGTAPGLRPGA
ncbi:hypothetical protein OPT61_g10700 [Boeremia exigua]|uniref:Uncharacterized protein n=1 Tax=Boeremia exigua TaxID=749465 RepID=A0ACC2HNJ5_9PLEO|nr:hypothetical protein OPT61_g10700 [Boeremia exigua]